MLLPSSRIALATVALVLVAAPAHAAGRPDLVISGVSGPKAVTAGATLPVSFRARNTGGAAARASLTRFYLTADAKASAKARKASRTDPRTSALDALLEGERAVGKLRARATSPSARATVTVPATLAPGAYTLLACADDRGAVRERNEANQCRAAKRKVTVAAAADAPGAWHSISDEQPLLDDATLAQRMQLAQQLSCTPAVPAKRVASVKTALKRIRAAVGAQVGAPALAAFNASPEAGNASASAAAATALLAEGNLGAALTAQLRAAELAPRDGAQLANAAALAVAAGHPNEALALLDGATVTGGSGLAYGVDRRAAAQQIRGMALLQLGQAAPAQQAFAAAAKADPSLDAEATSGQAARALCAGQVAAAAPLYRRAARRTPGNTPVALDESSGRASQLRTLALPGTPDEAVNLYARFDDLVERVLTGENTALHAAKGANQHAVNNRAVPPAERRRADALMRRVSNAYKRPEIRALDQQLADNGDRRFSVFQQFWGNGNADPTPNRYADHSRTASAACRGASSGACWTAEMRVVCTPSLRAHHQTWLAAVQAGRDLAQARLAALSKTMTGIAAHLEDPLLRENVRLQIAQLELGLVTGIAVEARAWGNKLRINAETCVKSPDGQTQGGVVGTDGAPTIDAGVACNSVTKNLSFVIDPGKLVDGLDGAKGLPKLPKLKVSCERLQLSYEFGPSAWAQPFVQVDWKFKAGTVTAFAGVRGKIEFSGRSDKLKAGLYLTASTNGIEDVGWRTSASVEKAIGPVLEVSAKQDWDVSFVPAFKDLGALVAAE